MILILEGVDCSGKSTLAQILSEKTGYEIVKGSNFKISELGADGMFNHMMKLLDKDNIIIDRFLYSNLVYGKLFDYPMMLPHQYDELVDKLDKKALLLYLYAPQGTIEHRMSKRGDDMIKLENISEIIEGYKNVIFDDFRPKLNLSVDTSTTDMNIFAQTIKEIIDLDIFKTLIKNT